MNPIEAPVQRQLDAYNAHDLERFLAEYTDRFTIPTLHARLVNRIVAGNIVVDHEDITGLAETNRTAVAVYEVVDGRIRTVWFF
jgi:hypothetical protein